MANKSITTTYTLDELVAYFDQRIRILNDVAGDNEEIKLVIADMHLAFQSSILGQLQADKLLGQTLSQLQQVIEQREAAYRKNEIVYRRGEQMGRKKLTARIVSHNPRLSFDDVLLVLEYLQGEAPGGRAAPVSEYYVEQIIEAWAELAAAILEEQGNNRASGE